MKILDRKWCRLLAFMLAARLIATTGLAQAALQSGDMDRFIGPKLEGQLRLTGRANVREFQTLLFNTPGLTALFIDPSEQSMLAKVRALEPDSQLHQAMARLVFNHLPDRKLPVLRSDPAAQIPEVKTSIIQAFKLADESNSPSPRTWLGLHDEDVQMLIRSNQMPQDKFAKARNTVQAFQFFGGHTETAALALLAYLDAMYVGSQRDAASATTNIPRGAALGRRIFVSILRPSIHDALGPAYPSQVAIAFIVDGNQGNGPQPGSAPQPKSEPQPEAGPHMEAIISLAQRHFHDQLKTHMHTLSPANPFFLATGPDWKHVTSKINLRVFYCDNVLFGLPGAADLRTFTRDALRYVAGRGKKDANLLIPADDADGIQKFVIPMAQGVKDFVDGRPAFESVNVLANSDAAREAFRAAWTAANASPPQ